MKKACTLCGQTFIITSDDVTFLKKVSPVLNKKKYSVPLPRLCPEHRYQRRLAFRNERFLYHRKCDLSGKSMISMHPANSPFPVYHITEWLSDKWDPMEYGQDIDFSRPFFDQFKEFCDNIPHFSAFIDPQLDKNAEYTNCSSEAKNCYMISQAEKNEDCYYSRGINNCKNCCDCFRVHKCELCYEVIDGNNCYHCVHCQDCDNSSECYFSTDLRSCSKCFGCHGLSNKKLHIFNEPVSEKVWTEKIEQIIFTQAVIAQMRERSAVTRLKLPQRAVRMIQCENCIGDHITNCRESVQVFDSNNLEHCAYCNEIANDAKDCHDFCMFGINCELLYECNGCGYNMYNVLFSNHCWQNISNLFYCESCFPSVKDCFGCFGLRRAQYCIFNKQYSSKEYEKLASKLIEHMQKKGEWGEFFPIRISPYGYNESLAQQFFPISKETAISCGWPWYEQGFEQDQYLGPDRKVPENIIDVPDDICDQIFRCSITKKPYKILLQELAFYRQLKIPIPLKCPQQRHKERAERRNPRKLWEKKCAKCKRETLSTFAPDRPEKIFCEACYLNSIG